MFDLELYNLQIELNEAQERIRKLEAQVEVMKCCGNCKHSYIICCMGIDMRTCDNFSKCTDSMYSYWQLKETQK